MPEPKPRSWFRKYVFLSELGILFTGIGIGACLAGDWRDGLIELLLPACAYTIGWAERHWNVVIFPYD